MNTILITVDALRADHLGQYGYHRETMPVLDELTAEGTLFKSTFANGPYTRISVPAFHTSRYLGYQSMSDLPTISSVLGEHGVNTCGIGTQTGFASIESDLLFDEFHDLGRDEHYEQLNHNAPFTVRLDNAIESVVEPTRAAVSSRIDDNSWIHRNGWKIYQWISHVSAANFEFKGYHSAERVTDEAINWLSNQEEDDFFLWLHYMEGHRPYGVHDPEGRFVRGAVTEEEIRTLMETAGTNPDEVSIRDHERLINLYDSDLHYCSRQLKRLFDELRTRGIWDESNIFFTSDHGEEFHEHGYYFHRNLPYDELIRVPLIVKSTGYESEVVTEQRELLDLAPTVCQGHGVDTSSYPFLGTNLFEGDARKVISIGSILYQDDPVVAVRDDGWKCIYDGESESLFNLDSDPHEQRSVADRYPSRTDEFHSEIPDRLFTREPERLRDPVDDVDKAQLEALGYLESQE